MKTRGHDVLYALRDLEQISGVRYVLSGDIARRLGRKDGRAVTPTLEDLERVGLVQRWPDSAHPNWRTTERGREVEKIISAADAHRGGEFAPLVDLPISDVERWVVAR